MEFRSPIPDRRRLAFRALIRMAGWLRHREYAGAWNVVCFPLLSDAGVPDLICGVNLIRDRGWIGSGGRTFVEHHAVQGPTITSLLKMIQEKARLLSLLTLKTSIYMRIVP